MYQMIREATAEDAGRIAEIEVESCRYAYKEILSRACMYDDMTAHDRESKTGEERKRRNPRT